MKRCTKCGCEKPLDEFYLDASKRGGVRQECKLCTCTRIKKRYAENVERGRERNNDYYARRGRARAKAMYYENVELMRVRNKTNYNNNKWAFLARSKQRTLAKIHRTPEWADKAAVAAIYRQARELRDLGIDCHVDHIVPLRGKLVSGLHVHNNLTIVLAKDNLSKGNRFDV